MVPSAEVSRFVIARGHKQVKDTSNIYVAVMTFIWNKGMSVWSIDGGAAFTASSH
jgi:hypothetical protein